MQPQKRVRGGKTRWVARYTDPTGKERSRTFSTRRQAAAYLTAQRAAMRDGTWVSPDRLTITVRDLALAWEAQSPSAGTRRFRHNLVRNLGDMSEVPVDRLPPSMVRAWVGHLRNGRPWVPGCTGVSHAYQAAMLNQFKAMLRQAVDDGIIPRSPAARVTIPRPGTAVTYADIPTAAEVKAMEQAAWRGMDAATRRDIAEHHGGHKQQRYQAFRARPSTAIAIRLGAATGMRAGEICGLTWPAVDFERGTIHIAVQATLDGDGLMPLKTGTSGRRTVSVDGETLAMLAEHRRRHPGAERVVLAQSGAPMSRGLLAHEIEAVRRVVGARDTANLKSLRHFHATALLQAGVPVKTVQHRLGHASAVMTLQVYAHFVPSDDAAAAGAIGGILSESGPGRDGKGRLRAV